MKQKFILMSVVLFGFIGINAQQVLIQGGVDPMLNTNSNVIMDFSTSFSKEAGVANDIGKGIVLPSTDLRKFEFEFSNVDGETLRTYFDGMIVYNDSTGATQTDGNRPSTSIDVVPGFYYFHNPNGYKIYENTGDQLAAIKSGIWKPLGSGDVKISSTKDSLFIGGDTILIATNPLGKAGGERGIIASIMGDSIGISLPEGTQTGDLLTWDAENDTWQPQTRTTKEAIWLPAVNLPWNTSGQESGEIDLFKIYQQSFDPTGGGGVPSPDGNGVISTLYGGTTGNYISSTGSFVNVPGHIGTTRASFDYVVTYFDKEIVTITALTADGKLRYKPATGKTPPVNAFISVMLVRK